MAETGSGSLPAETNLVDIVGGDAGELEARANGVVREVAIMFYTADAFFGNGE